MSFILQTLASTAQAIVNQVNENHLISNHDMQLEEGQTYHYVSNYAVNQLPPGKMLQVEPSPDMIDNSVVGEVKNYQQGDVGVPISLLLKSVARGKKKINKGNRVMKFSLKKVWQSASDTLKILPFVAKTPLKGFKQDYEGYQIKGISKYHRNNSIVF